MQEVLRSTCPEHALLVLDLPCLVPKRYVYICEKLEEVTDPADSRGVAERAGHLLEETPSCSPARLEAGNDTGCPQKREADIGEGKKGLPESIPRFIHEAGIRFEEQREQVSDVVHSYREQSSEALLQDRQDPVQPSLT